MSVTVNVLLAPPMMSDDVDAVRVTVAPLMRMGICDVLPLAVAVMVAVRVAELLEPEEKTTWALPDASVTADATLRRPVSAIKVTVIPGSAAFDPSTTIAVRVVEFELSDATVVCEALRLTWATTEALVVPMAENPNVLLVIVAPFTVAVAVTVSAPEAVPAFSVMVATPLASVRAVAPAGTNAPKPVPPVLKVTTTPGSAVPVALFNVAESVDAVVAEIALVDPESVKVGDAVTGVVVPVDDAPLPPPPHALSIANNANIKIAEAMRDEKIFNLCSCCGGLESCRS